MTDTYHDTYDDDAKTDVPDPGLIAAYHKVLQLKIVSLRRQRDSINAQLAQLVEAESRWNRAARIVDPGYEPLSIVVRTGAEQSEFEDWLEAEDAAAEAAGDPEAPELSDVARQFLSEAEAGDVAIDPGDLAPVEEFLIPGGEPPFTGFTVTTDIPTGDGRAGDD